MVWEGLAGKGATLKYRSVAQFHVSAIQKAPLAALLATKRSNYCCFFALKSALGQILGVLGHCLDSAWTGAWTDFFLVFGCF